MSMMMRQTALKSLRLSSTFSRAVGSRARMSAGSHMHNNDPEIIDKELHRKGKIDHNLIDDAPGWSEVMASVSEANIKADRFAGKPDPAETIKHIKLVTEIDVSTNKKPLTRDDVADHIVDPSEKEIIDGPLGKVLMDQM